MPIQIPAIFFNIWFRRAMLALVLFASYEGWKYHERGIGKKEGAAVESQTNATVQAKNQESDRQTTVASITQLTQQITVLTQAVSTLDYQVKSLKAQQAAVPQQVQGMPPAEVAAAIASALGHPQSTNFDSAQDQQQILSCFKQLPLCNQTVTKQEGEIDGLNSAIDKQEQKYVTLAGYTARVEQNYVALWNDKAQAKRSGKCLWLWKCSRPQIKAPNPDDLLKRPQ